MTIQLILRDILIPKLQRSVESLKRTDLRITEIKALPETEIIPGARNSQITLESSEAESFFFLGIAYTLDED